MAEISLQNRLTNIASMVRIDPSGALRFGETRIDVDCAPWAMTSTTPQSLVTRLTHALSLVLYYGGYCCREEGTISMVPENLAADPSLVQQLSEANQTRKNVERGWTLWQREPSGVGHFRKAGRMQVAARGRYESIESGSSVNLYSLSLQREDKDWLPTFYLAHSEALPNRADDNDNLRFYFHCDENSVVHWMRRITGDLNRYHVPFRVKCLNHPSLFTRSDALVLYVEKRYAQFVVRWLRSLAPESELNLFEKTPLFAKRIAPGIAIAEDPGSGLSFGQYRCQLLARALLDTHSGKIIPEWEVIGRVSRVFSEEGLRLEAAHLSAGSVDIYDVDDSVEVLS